MKCGRLLQLVSAIVLWCLVPIFAVGILWMWVRGYPRRRNANQLKGRNMQQTIKNRFTGQVLFSGEYVTIADAVRAAITSSANLRSADLYGADLSGAYLRGANLSGADLRGAYLYGADLRGANLRSANLSGANLRSADLYGADLSGAYLRGANLRSADLSGAYLRSADLSGANLSGAYLYGADLRGADLRGADLSGAYLSGAYLYGANLYGADLRGAYLRGADLSGANLKLAKLDDIKQDFWKVLSASPSEARAVVSALRAGKVDGSTYSGPCACLVGTIAKARACHHESIPGLAPNASRPAEKWFMGISAGDTPTTNQVAAISEAWALEWLKENHPESAETLEADAVAAARLAHFAKRRNEMFAAGDVDGLKAIALRQ